MSETRWKWPFKLPQFGRKSQQASDVSASPARDIVRLESAPATNVKNLQPESISNNNPEENTTGSLTIHSQTHPNVALRSGMVGNVSALHAENTANKVEDVGRPDSLSQVPHPNRAIKPGPSVTPEARTLNHDGGHKGGLDISYTSSLVPYALKWTEHKVELKQQTRLLKSSDPPEMTPDVLPRQYHVCMTIPNSSGELIIVGGKIPSEDGKDVSTDDVILLSTTDMSFTRLETNGERPGTLAGHRAVIAGRVLVLFGGGTGTFLYLLNLDTREWFKLRPPAPYPSPRSGQSLDIVDTTIWLYGGESGSNTLDDMWCMDLAEGIESARWRQVPKKGSWPKARWYHSTVYYDRCLYLFAGEVRDDEGLSSSLSDLWKFEIRTETWTEIECGGLIPQPRSGHSATVIEDNMFVFGGILPSAKKGEYHRTDDGFAFNFRDHIWRSLAVLGSSPSSTGVGILLAVDSQLLLVGGQAESKQSIYVAETRTAGAVRGSLPKLEFTTETTKLKFTSQPEDLSRFVRKQGASPHSLAGFSDVWKGEMTETKQPIAIKVLRVTNTSNRDDPESGRLRMRFDRELTIWMECQHPRVLELLGYAYIEGVPCLISPWCANGNIMEYLTKSPNADRRELIYQIAEGLIYLHGRDPPVVHSDIKPANILVNDEGNAKLCDFGISKLVLENPSGFTTTASVKGTLRYSSPEMLDLDGKSTTASDVWAFGMLILHVMTNKPPYVTILSDAKVIMAIMNGQKPLPADYLDLPPTDPLWDIMGVCWCEDPMKRPTMTDVFNKFPRSDTSI